MTIILDGTTGITTPTTSTTGEFVTSVTGFKNRLINGAMVIDQRNEGASITPGNGQYSVDRWQAALSQASKYTVQQNAGSVTPPAGFSNYLGVTSLSAYSSGSGDFFFLRQFVEGFNFADMAFGTANASAIALSFKVYSSLTGTFGGVVKNSATDRSYPFSYTISSANTWTDVSITIPGDTTGTWVGATNGTGIAVLFNLGSGSTFLGTAGAWASANLVGPTGATSVVGTNGATFYITGVQLEKGSTATSFDYRPYGTELALCQRYYEKSYEMATVPGAAFANSTWIGTVNPAATTAILGMAYFKASKRTAPTIAFWAEDGTSSNVTMPNVAAAVACTSASRISETGFGSITLSAANTASRLAGCNWTASSEL
jgi:hypothetical protein